MKPAGIFVKGPKQVLTLLLCGVATATGNVQASHYIDIAIDPFAPLRQQRTLTEDEKKSYYVDVLSKHNVSYDITAETTALVGEQIDLSSGGLSFIQTDVSIPGNNSLPVEVRRVFNDANFKQNATAEFSDWSLDLPSIHTTLMYAETQSTGSWGKGVECSGEQEPGPIEHKTGQILATSYWNGTVLLANGGQQHLLLVNLPDKKYTTKSHWKFTCYRRADGKGEGFRGVDPKGNIYKFDMPHAVQSFSNFDQSLARPYQVYLRVSSIEDPYGNWVKFNYTAYKNANQKTSQRLDNIQSNDGRLITFTYHSLEGRQHLVKNVTANGRSWEYQYSSEQLPTLAKTILPADPNNPGQSLFWQYDLRQLNLWHNNDLKPHYQEMQKSCIKKSAFTRGSVKHPDGALAEFESDSVIHGRTRIHSAIDFGIANRNSLCYISQAVKRKTLSGPGLAKMVWDYSYSENAGAYEDRGGAVPAAVALDGYDSTDLKTTTVLAPDGSKTINVFYRGFTYLEGQQVGTVLLDTNGTTELQRQWSIFTARQAYLGSSLTNDFFAANSANLSVPALETEKVVRLSGGGTQQYVTRFLNHNTFDKAEQWKETNSLGMPERTTTLSYQQDLKNWILNLETNRQINVGYESISAKSVTYYPADSAAKSLPKTESLFGQLVKSHEYHPDGNLRKTTYALNNRWVYFDQYKRGKPQHIRLPNRYDAGNFLVEFQVNDTGTIASAKDLNGNQTRYGYDVRNRVTLIDPVDNKWADTQVRYEADPAGSYALLQQISKGAYRKTVKLDALMQPRFTKEWDFNNEATTARYINKQFNAYGKAVFTSVPSQNSAEYFGSHSSFDGLQRLIAETNTANGDLTYRYGADNSVTIKNGRGYDTTTHYLAYGTPEQKLATAVHQPEALSTSVSYNIADLPTTIVQGGITEQRFYNNKMQLCLLKRPETGIKAMQYNALGQVEKYAEGLTGNGAHCTDFTQNAAAWVTVVYDNLGDQKDIAYVDGQTPQLSYLLDNQANLKTLTVGSIRWTYDYNSLNLLENESLRIDNKSYLIDQDYDALGNLQSLTVAGSTLYYAPNALGQPGKVAENNQNYATAVYFHPNQQLKSFTYGNGLLFSQTLDADHRPYERLAKLGSSAQVSQRYTYDLNNNIEAIYNLVDNSKTVSLSYDDLDRLETASGYWGNGNFVYDVLGNIKNKNLGTQQLTYSYDTSKNRLQSVTGGYNFVYDDRGNVLNNGKRSFNFNRANQITTSGNVTYQYDGHGRRVKKLAGTTSYSVYNKAGQLMLTDGPQGITRYIYLGKELIAKTGSSAALEDKPGYTGHLEDRDIGLTYMQQRYYDSVIGRFYSNDPVGFVESHPSSFGRYTYANNNPYKYVDPDGRWGLPGAIYGAIAGATGGFVASGSGFKSTVIGTLAGAAAGAAVGAVAPQTSHVVGLAAAGAVASAGGQAVGSVASAAVEKGVTNVTTADVKVDPVTTVLGGVGAGVGGVVGKGVSQMTMRPIVGQTLDKAGAPTAAGMAAGSVTEGAVIGGAEKIAPQVSEALNKIDDKLNN